MQNDRTPFNIQFLGTSGLVLLVMGLTGVTNKGSEYLAAPTALGCVECVPVH